MKVMKEKVTQWRLKQRQQVRHQLQHPEGEARGLEHQPLQIPPDAFQIILERLDGLREVQIEQSERMATMQDQLDVLSAKFDSITTHHEH